jgi:hypothetical protein
VNHQTEENNMNEPLGILKIDTVFCVAGVYLGLLKIIHSFLFEFDGVEGVGGRADLGWHRRVVGEGDQRLGNLRHLVIIRVDEILQGVPELFQIRYAALHVVEVILEFDEIRFHVRCLQVGGSHLDSLRTRGACRSLHARRCRTAL